MFASFLMSDKFELFNKFTMDSFMFLLHVPLTVALF